MAESAIPVDLLNPGHVFACLGIMEAADLLLGGAAGAFDWHAGRETTFRVAATGANPPVERVMRFLEEAEVVTRAPAQSANLHAWKASWGAAPEVDEPGTPFPFPDPKSPERLPAVLRDDAGNEITLNHWGDATAKRDEMKFWTGANGTPGVAVVRNAVNAIRQARNKTGRYADDPFALPTDHAIRTTSLRFDWRGSYVPVQEGFSLNEHKKTMHMVRFPIVEVLAAIGLTDSRASRKSDYEYRYGVLGERRRPTP